MATIKRSEAGGYLWRMHVRSLIPWLLLTFVCSIGLPIFIFWYVLPGRLDLVTVLGYFLLLGILLVIMWSISRLDSRIEDGARGEKLVGRELERLYKMGFSIFHDYKEAGSGNVDHFIVGPPGVFAIETKAWRGTISSDDEELHVGGKKISFRDPIKQVKGEAKDINRLIKDTCGIKCWVNPVICFSRGELRIHGSVGGVEIVDVGSLNRLIMTHRGWRSEIGLSRSQVRAVSNLLQKRLGVLPGASPDYPPVRPGLIKRALNSGKFYVAAYSLFLFILSVVFAENTAATFDNISSIYRLFVS